MVPEPATSFPVKGTDVAEHTVVFEEMVFAEVNLFTVTKTEALTRSQETPPIVVVALRR